MGALSLIFSHFSAKGGNLIYGRKTVAALASPSHCVQVAF